MLNLINSFQKRIFHSLWDPNNSCNQSSGGICKNMCTAKLSLAKLCLDIDICLAINTNLMLFYLINYLIKLDGKQENRWKRICDGKESGFDRTQSDETLSYLALFNSFSIETTSTEEGNPPLCTRTHSRQVNIKTRFFSIALTALKTL